MAPRVSVASVLQRSQSLERFSNSYALASFFKCGFYFHPSDADLSHHPSEQSSLAGDPASQGARLRKKPLNGLFSEYTYWRTAIPAYTDWFVAAALSDRQPAYGTSILERLQNV
jgi:hypothetical protein